jgi:hypothetical protein
MWVAGAFEGFDPAFPIVPNVTRNLIYIGRLFAGAILLGVSISWWRATTSKPAVLGPCPFLLHFSKATNGSQGSRIPRRAFACSLLRSLQ